MAGWKRRAGRRAASRPAGPAPTDLRVHLPLVWPDGPDGPVDVSALQSLAREYARTGRGVEQLLGDLDQLCAVVGIGTPSRAIEVSSVAWADAFLDTVGLPGPGPSSLAEVERRVMHEVRDEWRDLVPGSRLILLTWDAPDARPGDSETMRVVAEVRAVFPGSAVATRAPGRVVAAVDGGADLERRTTLLRSRCSELVGAAAPTVQVVPGPVDPALARELFRSAG